MFQNYNSRINKSNAYELALEIAKNTGLIRDLSIDRTPEGIVRFENIQELLNGIQEFTKGNNEQTLNTLGDFLVDVALLNKPLIGGTIVWFCASSSKDVTR